MAPPVAELAELDALLLSLFIESYGSAPASVTLDIDATDDPLHGRQKGAATRRAWPPEGHGHQEGRFFHGDYDGYCYLPLYIFSGEQVLCAAVA